MTQRFKSVAPAILRGLVCSMLIVLFAPSVARAQDDVVYYHLDAIGSVRATTDAAGAVIHRYDYLPFGEPWAPPSSADVIRFAGKERDVETDLDYFGARYYRDVSGRFTTVDPVLDIEASLEDPQLWNRYSYSLNSPIAHIDSDGRFPIPLILAGISAAAASPAGQRAMIVGSAYLQRYAGLLQRVALTQGQAISNQVFSLPPLLRGKVIDSLLGTQKAFANFPGIDDFADGVAISRKSIDLFANSYQKGDALFSKLSGYVDDLAAFAGGAQGANIVRRGEINKRLLEVVVPKGGISQYQDVLRRLVEYARKYRNLEITFKEAK